MLMDMLAMVFRLQHMLLIFTMDASVCGFTKCQNFGSVSTNRPGAGG